MCKLKMFWTGRKESVSISVQNWEDGKKIAEFTAKKVKKEINVTFQDGCIETYGFISANGIWE